MGSSNRRSKPPKAVGNRNRPRKNQRPEVARCFDALNRLHTEAPDPDTARSLKLIRQRLIALEKEHNAKAGAMAQIERWASRCTAVMAFFLIHPLLAWWDAAGYPHPGRTFWSDDNVIASMSTALGYVLAVMIVARVVVGAIMGWLLVAIVGCLMFAWLFRI